MMRSLRAFLLFAYLFSGITGARASRNEDSLHVAVDGMMNARDRAKALLRMAEQTVHSRPGESLVRTKDALSFAEQCADRTLMHEALVRMRGLQFHFGAQDEFLQTAIRAMEISEAMSDAKMMADDLQWLSQAYETVGDMDKAVESSRKALFLLTTTGDSAAMGKGMLHLLNELVKAGRFDEVMKQGNHALAYYTSKNDSAGEAMVWTRNAEALLAQNKQADALPLLHKAERMLALTDEQEERLRVLTDLTEAYTALPQFDRANDFLNSAMALCEQLEMRNEKPRLLGLASRIAEGRGHLAEALLLQRAQVSLVDSLFKARVADRMAGLQSLYQVGQKENDLNELRSKNEANEALLESGRSRGYVWLTVFSVMLVMLVYTSWVVVSRRRAVRRIRLKNTVIRQQAEEIHAKNLELERQNMRLAETLISEEEKEVLLKEIHHRVKNNLQIVNTLLRLQSIHLNDARIEALFQECQGRVRSMALVHEHIYRNHDLSRVDVGMHLQRLSEGVLDSYGLRQQVELEVVSHLETATIDTLIPLSLLINELLTNTAKHAFGASGKGRVRIVLHRDANDACELFYSDDGCGFIDLDAQRDSFGMELVRTLAAQLDGELRVIKGQGTTVVVTFQPSERKLRAAS